MEKYEQVMEDIKSRIKYYRDASEEYFMEKDSTRFRFFRDVATGLEEALELMKEAYEEHPSDE